ncbi:GNAT family N-acetyltransferase [Nostoc sp. FACHB-888]|uniref:GNAT family N-acetyltransferase n=1 Tax=Nostoc sp. FACHB-888 TaxID=2692842 RepID=UPI001F54B54C|nr:GNAT family N-acetyltransferase [Nostoc sp. FACHB-888]
MAVNLIIRLAEPQDLSILVKFNQALAQEARGQSLNLQKLTKGIQAVLKDANRGFYILAEKDDKVIGSTFINFEWSDWSNAWYWWLLDIYVEPNHRKKDVFRSLYAYLITEAKAADVCGLRLYVYKGNTSAQKVFQKLGMVTSDSLIFEERLFPMP